VIRYTASPNLRNLDILHVAAEYVDARTLQILIAAGHWGLRAESRNTRGFTMAELIRGRKDRNPELERFFAILLRAVNGMPTKIEKEREIEA
jgi:hypothetical protein